MTKTAIIAELRRSAVEDADPWCGLDMLAFYAASDWLRLGEHMSEKSPNFLRTLILLVGCALETE